MLLDNNIFNQMEEQNQQAYLFTLQVWHETRGVLETYIETEKMLQAYDPSHIDTRIPSLQEQFTYYSNRLQEFLNQFSKESNKI